MTISLEDRYRGGLLGLALGDAVGAPFEGGPIERLLWRCIGRTRGGEMRWTDDTQMSMDLAESLIDRGEVDRDDLARRFAASYRWSRGYGPGAARVLKRIRRGMPWQDAVRSVHADGSFGNGAAMRAPVVGLAYAHRAEALADNVQKSAVVTHAHPLGVEGALIVAGSVAAAARGESASGILAAAREQASAATFTSRLQLVEDWYASCTEPSVADVRVRLGTGIAAAESCITAVHVAVRFLDRPLIDALSFVRACGGDVDTISAMAGAIWGTVRGGDALPREHVQRLEQRDRVEATATRLHARMAGP